MGVTDIAVQGSLVLGTLLKIMDTSSSFQEPQMGDLHARSPEKCKAVLHLQLETTSR